MSRREKIQDLLEDFARAADIVGLDEDDSYCGIEYYPRTKDEVHRDIRTLQRIVNEMFKLHNEMEN